MGEPLFDAVVAMRKMRSHEARRRQMQLIGKLMRSAEVEPIREAVAQAQLGRARDSLALHDAETLARRTHRRLCRRRRASRRSIPEADLPAVAHARSQRAEGPVAGGRTAQRQGLSPSCSGSSARTNPMREHGRRDDALGDVTADPTSPMSPMAPASTRHDSVRIGVVSISDRASAGVYEDKGIPALRDWLGRAVLNPIEWQARLIADDETTISATLRELADDACCDLVLTTGGTGPAPRDVTPEATLAVATKEMPGFGEQMRRIGLSFVPTAILSRQVAVIRGKTLIINLPGQPKAISETPRRHAERDRRRCPASSPRCPTASTSSAARISRPTPHCARHSAEVGPCACGLLDEGG